MGMLRSLDSGVTGMLNNQLTLDVSANNLANVNTPGFKSSRVSFSNALIQTTFAGSAPGTNIGGQNPRQVGLGVATTSIDVDFSQGALSATGRDLDLSIQGDGFFEVNDGTRSSYTRVGNFGIDSQDQVIHLSTGYRLYGNTYNQELNPDGSQSILDQNVPLTIDQNSSFPPSQTSEISFQGNLDSNTTAIQGSSLQSVYPVINALTGEAATEDTALSNLNIFKNLPEPTVIEDRTKNMYVFGTKPNGETYAGRFTIQPWEEPTATDPTGSLGDLMTKINDSLAHGNERFGSARVENGNIIISSVGAGDGFSFFMGEDGRVVGDPPNTPAAPLVPGQPPFFSTPLVTTIPSDPSDHMDTDIDAALLNDANTSNTATMQLAGNGLLDPTFTVIDPLAGGAGTVFPLNSPVTISVNANGREIGSITMPIGTQDGDVLQLPGYPHVSEGDTITYSLIGAPANLDVQSATRVILDSNANNITQNQNNDTVADMFEEDTSVDANAFVYLNEANSTLNWYRMRTVPEVVTTSIEVFDSQGGRHTVEARYFRIGTKTEDDTSARINSWDMMINIGEGEGDIVDDLVTGIEFDQEGRFTGSVGTTIHNTTLNSTAYVGSPATATFQVNWASTGPTDPATIRTDFGDNNTVNGLTGFGSPSTAAAVDQDGFQDGQLDSISVSSEGDIIALYTNGVSRNLAQIPLVTFSNPAGLNAMEGNLWQISTNSGSPTRRTAGLNSGFITSGSLESSNVDISTEFTRLITAQRGFQVSARVIQTTDEVLEELANLIR